MPFDVAKENETDCEAAPESATTNVACVVPEFPSTTEASRTEIDGDCCAVTLVANSRNIEIITRLIRRESGTEEQICVVINLITFPPMLI